MFNVYTFDKEQGMPKDDICYIIAKGGVYLKKKMGLIDSLVPVKNISFLEDIGCYASMDIPKIPGIIYAQIFDFFKKVYHGHRAEGLAIIYYNPKKKAFKVHIPEQSVSGASVNVEDNYQISIKNYQPVCSIHSHPGFSAFHSGTDTHDEEDFDGLHITVGEIDSDTHKIVASIASNGYRVEVDPLDYIDGVYKTEYTKYFKSMFRPKYEVIGKEKVYQKEMKTTTGYIISQHLSSVECDPKWLINVEKYNFRKAYSFGGYGQHNNGYSFYSDGGYGGNINDDLENDMWFYRYMNRVNGGVDDHEYNQKKTIHTPNLPQTISSSAIKSQQSKYFNPCYKCNLKFAKDEKELLGMIKKCKKDDTFITKKEKDDRSKIIETEELISVPLWPYD
jgi:proteasome lid subunit RPN8/RPN11